MKRTLLKSVRIWMLALCCLASTTAFSEVNPKPFVIPELQSWTGSEGTFTPSGRLIVKGGKAAQNVAELFAQNYSELLGKKLTIVKGSPKKGDIVLSLQKNTKKGGEAYQLNIKDFVELTASNAQALTWGTRTILQLSEQSKEKTGQLPKGVATDAPEYAVRGFMIDCGRKFIPMSYLRSLVKIMSYYKMNTLQIHLNDNGFRQYFGNDWDKTQAAFRLESTTYPGLTAKDGSYTKAEFIELQKLAEQYGVEIIPEIDVPAHSLAFTHYKPEIGSKEYGMDHLDLSKQETYDFVDGLFKEYLEGKNPVFRGKRVHIGTDEYSNAKKEVVEQFRSFTDHYIKLAESYGKQAVVWGALTHAAGDTPVKSENVIMNCWYNGYADPTEMKKQGYKLISIPDGLVYIVPAAGYYYDYLNCKYLYETWTPATIGGTKFEENDPDILGGMFAVWNDHAGNGISVKDIHDRVYPALQTLSVKCWTGKNTTLPYDVFESQRLMLSEAPAVNEAARIADGKAIEVSEVKSGDVLPVKEVGYDYTVSFTLQGADEEKGTVLFSSPNATFYLADPKTGKLGFSRDGYLNTFNYKVKAGERVNIAVQGNNKMTRLLVNGKVQEELAPLTLYAVKETDRTHFQDMDESAWQPVVYNLGTKMYYQRTLVFPLEKAGNFRSKITNLRISNLIDK